MSRNPTSRASLVLFSLFFFGWAVTVLAWIDVQWTHQVFVARSAAHSGKTEGARP